VILNAKSLGVSGEGKILLKTIHAYIGYVFVINLSWRLVWGFIGNKYVRWKAILPIGKGYGH
jgi:cytochrome b